jgi:AcrR family transcriptional regulator
VEAAAEAAAAASRERAARPLRADAQRNRTRVLEAARRAFASEGLAVPLDEIARRAGVGAGTVYRHFPSKEALFEAVVVDRLEHLAEVGRAALAEAGSDAAAGPAFFCFFRTMVADAHEKMDLADALSGTGVYLREATLAAGRDLTDLLSALLARAQAAGAVRDDIDLADVHALTIGAVAAERRQSDATDAADAAHRAGRVTKVICDGLRPPAGPTAG